jgi:copper chaperone NosL
MTSALRFACALAAFASAALGLAACRASEGPRPIAYDRESCAHCRMLISEPRFAAQLETAEGEVRSFDDPGCLLADLATRSAQPRALWFHHVREERWLDAAHVAFEPAERTPMGYGLAAVDAGTPGALSLAQAQARVAAAAARTEPRP